MAEFTPTPSQLAAMTTRGCALLVSAGAGSGKTKVLTERVLRAVCDNEHPADLDSFLVISFTRAAAGELRGRLMEELAARLAADPGNQRLRRQSALIPRAQIGTIHSFCAQLLRENCQAAGLSPDFRVLDEERADAMKSAALDRVLEECYANPESIPGFLSLADTAGEGRDDRSLAALVLSLHQRMQCHARPERWAREQTQLLSAPCADADQTPWGRELLDWARAQTDFYAAELEGLIPQMAADAQIQKAYADHFGELADLLRELSRRLALGWDAAAQALPFASPRLPGLRKPENPELADFFKDRRSRCLEAMKKISAVFAMPSEGLLRDMAGTAPAMAALLELTLRFDRAYARDKRERALADYADLEHFAARLLTDENDEPTPLARSLSERYTEIMVDEYQDVSRVQDTIFRALSDGGRKLFLVGDVKQSIYRFRLADPEIFNEKYRAYANADPAVAQRILLRENFRSRGEILDGANAVFSLCMSRELGDVDYDEEAALIRGADWYEGAVPKPELLLLRLPAAGAEDSPDKTDAEAAFVARKIKALVESGATVAAPGGTRPMEYGDVAILLRSANNVGGAYRKALLKEGVPVGKAQGSGFFTSVEISTLMSILTLLDNPHKDIPLIAVLRSAAFGFTPDELARIRAADKEADLYSALEKAAAEDGKCRDFLEKLSQLRLAVADLSAAQTVWEIIERFDLLALCSAMSDGHQRRENLMAFVTLSESFESSGYRGLHRFVLWAQALAEKGQEPAAGGAASAVQILSIHKSKGLEFPVVFLCDTARRFNRSERAEPVLVHPELGLGPRVVDLERRVRYPSLARMAIARRQEKESLSEEMPGGYSLYDYPFPWYQSHLRENGVVLRSPFLPDRTAKYQGSLPYCFNPAKTVYVRRNIEHVLKCGYMKSELEFFLSLTKTMMPFFQWWYTDLAMYEPEDGIRTDWRLERTRIRTRLTADGVIRPKWKHELSLFQAVRQLFPDTLYQYRPEWLGRQSLDLYIPSLQTAIEYQGIQHFLPIDFFGGDEALQQRQNLDRQKKDLCRQNGVTLIEWPYRIEPTEENVRKTLIPDSESDQ